MEMTLVYNGFYKEMEAIFKESPSAGAAFSRTNYIDYGGRITGVTGMIQDNEGIVPDILEKTIHPAVHTNPFYGCKKRGV